MPTFDVPRPEKAIKKKKEKREKHRKYKKPKKHKKHKKHKKKHHRRHGSISSSTSASSGAESPVPAVAALPSQDAAFDSRHQLSAAASDTAAHCVAGGDSNRIVPDRYKLFVGSLAWTTSENTLQTMFSKFGRCQCRLVCERDEPTRSRGFAFVSFADETPMLAACSALDGAEVDGRQIKVNTAQPREAAGPNWTCPKCSANCYPSKRECFKCGTPRVSDNGDESDLAGAGGRHWRDRAPSSKAAVRSSDRDGNSSGREHTYKYNASARRNMEKTVAEEAAEEDDARMRAYLARKAARSRRPTTVD